ncbi:hypothetical protein AG1IA_05969 [Rhizoctonia solani AG-1 IA]|uniref:Thiolase N-terminal domain-containing protein n=1 Tax=Thanatephorus cucumeris (strain AG1-IA) TaxID=983506 RepID=L8WT74_THACA|nr:hypothetical protein AG1IA_05969 [Rhizoctonia solani AG-1 IA]
MVYDMDLPLRVWPRCAARSAFPDWGQARSTGANSSQVTDGAAVALLMRRSTAEKLGLADKIIAKHVATSVVA